MEPLKHNFKETLHQAVRSTKGLLNNTHTGIKRVLPSFRKNKASSIDAEPSMGTEYTEGTTPEQAIATSIRPSFINKITTHKKLLLVVALVLFVIVVGLALSYFYFLRDDAVGTEGAKEASVFSILKQGDIVGTFTVGEKARFGDLQVSLHNIVEDSYRTLETDSDGTRMTRGYIGAQIEVFNMSNNTNDVLYFGLTDDQGNQYERDREIEFYLNSTKDFGIAKEIYPRSIRDGYLLFPAPSKEARKLQLIVFSDVRKEKIVFDIER